LTFSSLDDLRVSDPSPLPVLHRGRNTCLTSTCVKSFLRAHAVLETNDYVWSRLQGNAWTSRFRRLMNSHSLVLKSTICTSSPRILSILSMHFRASELTRFLLAPPNTVPEWSASLSLFKVLPPARLRSTLIATLESSDTDILPEWFAYVPMKVRRIFSLYFHTSWSAS
jgi:hypothetical protein